MADLSLAYLRQVIKNMDDANPGLGPFPLIQAVRKAI